MATLAPTTRPSRSLALARRVALSMVTICALSVFCLVMGQVRRHVDPGFGFLRWNLFLAWLPLALAYALSWAAARTWAALAVPLIGAMWILFLPNAPYLITDLVHLRRYLTAANALTFGALALTGLLLAIKSVQLVQGVMERRFGARAGWRTAQVSALLAAIGVYIGRVHRWNSWSVISHPRALADAAFNVPVGFRSLGHAMVGTVAVAVSFYASYRLLTGRPEATRAISRVPPSLEG
jgi:uncharacterized membrane protein